MKRKDREITDFNEIMGILSRCDVIRMGLNGRDYPYVVPLSFGFEAADGKILIYFHGAKDGHKHDLISADSRACVEADIFGGYTKSRYGITTVYESVIGFGTVETVTGEGALHGLRLLLEHCGYPDVSIESCAKHTRVYKITLDSVTGKRNGR